MLNEIDDDLMSSGEVAVRLKTAPKTLQWWRQTGQGPPFIRISPRRVFYSRRALEQWLRKRTIQAHAAV
jgi:hypothetical protein